MRRTWNRWMLPGALLALFAGPLLLPGWNPAWGTDLLNQEIDKLAEAIKKRVEGSSVAVGEITGPAGQNANAGPGLQLRLIQALRLKEVTVKNRDPGFEVKGEYQDVQDENDKAIRVLQLTLTVRNRTTGRKVDELSLTLPSNPDLAVLLGLTVAFTPGGTFQERNRELQDRIRKPAFHPDGNAVRSKVDSPFGVEVLVRKNEKETPVSRKPTDENGQAFVGVARGEQYLLRIHNDSTREMAVAVLIDGLDVFTVSEDRGKDGRPRFTHWLVPAKKAVVLEGWHRSNDKGSFAFQVVPLAESVLAKAAKEDLGLLQGNAKRGTITVCFHPTAPEGSPRSAGDATGVGPPIPGTFKEAKRVVRDVIDVVTVRYTR